MEKKTKKREECWWFNQGSLLSIRHYADGERVSEGHRRREKESERMRRKLKKNDCGNITGLQEKGKGVCGRGQAEGN